MTTQQDYWDSQFGDNTNFLHSRSLIATRCTRRLQPLLLTLPTPLLIALTSSPQTMFSILDAETVFLPADLLPKLDTFSG